MTKYVLHGGNTREINPDNESFFAEMTRGLTGEVKILLNNFSREEDEVQKCATEDQKRFLENISRTQLTFEIANEKKLTEQIQRCDVMYIRGGRTAKLVAVMKKIPQLETLFKDKVIGGSSAGVYMLAKHYWENDEDILGNGLGIFNIKALCHYAEGDREIILQKLQTYQEDLPILTLPNYKWILLFK